MDEASTFGGWVRQRRKALDLTQENLAERIGCAVETIRKIESGRRRPSRQLVELLARCFRVPQAEWPRLVQFARGCLVTEEARPSEQAKSTTTTPPLNPPQARRLAGLPVYLTSFVGREADIEAISKLVLRPDIRLITLTGAGGTGKTRLAVQVSSESRSLFTDGVCFVSLGPVTQPSLVSSALASALGIDGGTERDPAKAINRFLRNKNMLLVFDNFEHLMQAAPVVGQILESSTQLKVFVTSREPLHLYGEQEYPVPPLTLPDFKPDRSLTQIETCESVALFIRRARAFRPDFELSPENALAVMEICRRVDGLPLAIELVVSRMNVLPPRALLARMGTSLQMLTGGPKNLPARQQTLRATIDWSYQRLNRDEKTLFCKLGAFANGFTLSAVEAVCGAPAGPGTSTVDLIESLIDKSLLTEFDGRDGEPRFTMLNTVREFARERLFESEEAGPTLDRCALYYLALAESAERERTSPEYTLWLDRLEADHHNILAALGWCREGGDIGTGLRLAASITRFWYVRGYVQFAYEQFSLILDKAREFPPSVDRVKVFCAAGEAALELERVEMAHILFAMGLKDARQVGDRWATGLALLEIGCSSYLMGDCEAGRVYLEEALSLLTECGDQGRIAVAFLHLGEVMRCKGDISEARSYYTKALKQYREQGARSGLAYGLYKFGTLEFEAGNHEAALPLFRESLALSSMLRYNLCTVGSLVGLGAIAASSAEPGWIKRAAMLFGASESLVEESHLHISANDRMDCEAIMVEGRTRIGDKAWARAWSEGRAAAVEQVIEFVLEGWPEAKLPESLGSNFRYLWPPD